MSRELLPNEESIVVRALGILRRRALVATIAFTTVMAAAVAFALYLPDLYRSQAVLLVERPLGDTVVRSAATNDLESRLYAIKTTILSRDRLTELVDRFGLYPDLRARGSFEDVLNQARQDIEWEPNGPEQVSGRNKTVTFTLSYTGDNRQTVADVTNAVAGFYVAHNEQMRAAEAHSATQFMKLQLDNARTQADAAQQKLNAFVASNQSQLPQSASVNAVTYTRLGDDLRRNLDQQMRVTDSRQRFIDTLEEATEVATAAATTPAAAAAAALGVEPSKEFTDLSARLDKSREALQDLLRKGLAEAHPDVRTTREAIDALETELEAQRQKDIAAHKAREAQAQAAAAAATTGTAAPPRMPRTQRSVESFDAELERLKKEEAQIRSDMARLLERFDTAPGVQQQYLLLQRDLESAKERYDVALRNFEEAKLAEGVETSGQAERFTVLESAIPPEGPAAPNRPRLLIMGLLLALAAAAAAVIAREQLDSSFHSIDDLREFTAIPVLASIPEIGAPRRRAIGRLALGTASALAAIILVGTVSAYIANGNETLVRMLQRAG